jgi:hypothetical protein
LGIDAVAHNRGVTPTRVQRWLDKQQDLYGWTDEGDGEFSVVVNGETHVGYLPSGRDLADLIEQQERAESAYATGDQTGAERRWSSRNRSAPEWMYFYHGHFS